MVRDTWQKVRFTVVGDVGVGKTCLLIQLTSNKFPTIYIPGENHNCFTDVVVDGKPFHIDFTDIIRQEEFEFIRPMFYPTTDVFFLCFALDDRSSFENIEHKWWPEVNGYCPDTPKIIVGCKQDLREPSASSLNTDLSEFPGGEESFVSHNEGDALVKKLGCATYCETSALTGKGKAGILEDADNQLEAVTDGSGFGRQDLNKGLVAGIAGVYEEKSQVSGRMHTVIELTDDIKSKTFAHVLEFLYTGLPNFTGETTQEDLANTSHVARMFQLPLLETVCVNKRKDEVFLNPSIGEHLNGETGSRLKELFFNRETLADIVFNVEGTKVYAHKAILSARCEVMAAMFSGNFIEGMDSSSLIEMPGVSLDPFLVLLEYLYTDQASLEKGNLVDIMIIADQFCLTRLVSLCEHYIAKEVYRSCRKNIKNSDIDVIGLLLISQVHNASQLEKWCLHFISTNYRAFRHRSEFSQLSGSDLEYVEEHQWPPLSYFKKKEEYENFKIRRRGKCICQGKICSIM